MLLWKGRVPFFWFFASQSWRILLEEGGFFKLYKTQICLLSVVDNSDENLTNDTKGMIMINLPDDGLVLHSYMLMNENVHDRPALLRPFHEETWFPKVDFRAKK